MRFRKRVALVSKLEELMSLPGLVDGKDRPKSGKEKLAENNNGEMSGEFIRKRENLMDSRKAVLSPLDFLLSTNSEIFDAHS